MGDAGDSELRARLLGALEAERRKSETRGKRNHMADVGLSASAVVTSAAAGLLAAKGFQDVPAFLTAVIAALPALFTSMQRVIDYRARAAWYFRKSAALHRLAINLQYGAGDLRQTADDYGLIETGMEAEWPKAGAFQQAGSADDGPRKRAGS